MTNVAAVLLSLFPLLLSRARASCDENLSQFEARSFLWENGLPKFIDSHDNLCNLTSNKTRDQVGVRYNVLSFGDSYELEFCRVRPFGLQYHPQSQPHIYGDCSFQNESINYKLHRGYGQQGDPKALGSGVMRAVYQPLLRWENTSTNQLQLRAPHLVRWFTDPSCGISQVCTETGVSLRGKVSNQLIMF
jgi:hypothetical protein